MIYDFTYLALLVTLSTRFVFVFTIWAVLIVEAMPIVMTMAINNANNSDPKTFSVAVST